ncbi:DUF6678 family protein [Ruminococcus sp.]|uniref:DUF6678 family protein n=1 Tax=Ruminococcus sp. TaxID=41978 RepID=UPI0025FBD99A|nr:DUF6678 family protein [Ruminococcus sp.]MBQ8966576.1 hypothetical protein [Ruminococcus sp.]
MQELLRQKLHAEKGSISEPQEGRDIFEICWKGGICFRAEILPENTGRGFYCVMRDGQAISPAVFFRKTDDRLLSAMQGLINDIDRGRYDRKKTLREMVRLTAEERRLVSCMNDTKWRELFSALKEKCPRVDIRYKSLFEEDPPEGYSGLWEDEGLDYTLNAELEWVKLRPVTAETIARGALLDPRVITTDDTALLKEIFAEYNIPHEYDEAEQAYVVWGYK